MLIIDADLELSILKNFSIVKFHGMFFVRTYLAKILLIIVFWFSDNETSLKSNNWNQLPVDLPYIDRSFKNAFWLPQARIVVHWKTVNEVAFRGKSFPS